jgi:hypothetical protein
LISAVSILSLFIPHREGFYGTEGMGLCSVQHYNAGIISTPSLFRMKKLYSESHEKHKAVGV